MPKKRVARAVAIHRSVVEAFFASGFLKAPTPFEIASIPVSATAPEENPRDQKEESDTGGELRLALDGLEAVGVLGDSSEVARERSEQADDDQDRQGYHVPVGGHGEEAARLLDATQVGEHQKCDGGKAQRHAVILQAVDRTGDGRHSGRYRDGHGQHVVDQKGGAGHERGDGAEILPCHDVRATATWVGLDRLAVAGGDDGEEHDDEKGHRVQVLQ